MGAYCGAGILAAGRVLYTAGAPGFSWQTGQFDNTIADTGAGIATITCAGGGFDAAECAILVTPEAASGTALAASTFQTSDTVKGVTIGAPTDPVAFGIVVVGLQRG